MTLFHLLIELNKKSGWFHIRVDSIPKNHSQTLLTTLNKKQIVIMKQIITVPFNNIISCLNLTKNDLKSR